VSVAVDIAIQAVRERGRPTRMEGFPDDALSVLIEDDAGVRIPAVA
jgi:hypothetical protein